jgi:hypothetical protein
LFDLSSPQRIIYSNCASPLELIKITGGGHQWPGISTLIGGAGTINMDFYSPQVIWDFLSGKSCPPPAEIDENVEEAWKLYPNPVNDFLLLNFAQEAYFDIRDLQGKQVLSGNYSNPIPVAQLSQGVYVLRITTEKKSHFLRFVKGSF